MEKTASFIEIDKVGHEEVLSVIPGKAKLVRNVYILKNIKSSLPYGSETFMSTKVAAAELGISVKKVLKLVADKKLHTASERFGIGYLISQRSIDEYKKQI